MASKGQRGTEERAWASGYGGSESESQLCCYSPRNLKEASVSPLGNRDDNTNLISQSLWVQDTKKEFELD